MSGRIHGYVFLSWERASNLLGQIRHDGGILKNVKSGTDEKRRGSFASRYDEKGSSSFNLPSRHTYLPHRCV